MVTPLQVEIWSDVVCPWCYIGKRRFEQALDELGDEVQVEVAYRPYQLDPNAPVGRATPVSEVYARKFGGPEQAAAILDRVTRVAEADGIEFRMDLAWRSNTLDAHRLLWLAEQPDSPVAQPVLKERLLKAYFTDGLDVGDTENLVCCAAELGMDPDHIRRFLDSEEGMTEVSALLSQAHELGISGVPAFVIDGAWTIPGAQDPDVFVQVLRKMWNRRVEDEAAVASPVAGTGASGDVCADDACDV